jgi:hypothetical protein
MTCPVRCPADGEARNVTTASTAGWRPAAVAHRLGITG